MKGGLVLTEEPIASLMAYLTEREPDIKGIVERLEKALAAIKEEEEVEPELERHGAT